jgi:hypothetical protein
MLAIIQSNNGDPELKIGRGFFKYSEGSHTMIIGAPVLVGENEGITYEVPRNAIQQWLPPHENEIVTNIDVDRILNNICALLAKHGRATVVT